MPNAESTVRVPGAGPSAQGLRGVRLLAGVADATLGELAQQYRWRRVIAGQRVVSRDAPDHDVYLIVSGKVRITVFSAAGRQLTFRDMQAGDWFGDLAAIDGRPRSADVDALEDAVLASMKPAQFMHLLHDHPAVCDRILQRLVGLVRDLSDRIFDVSTRGVRNRLQAEVLRLAREAGVAANRARIDRTPRHADIASQIGTYREQVTRELSGMAKEGLVQRDGRALVIPDVERLERIVSESRRST